MLRTLRILFRYPGFAAAAVASIALGIGLNTTVYSLVRMVLLQPLPYRDAERLVYVWETHARFTTMAVAAPDYQDWKQARSFERIAAYTIQTMNRGILLGEGEPLQVQAVMASHELLPMLGVQPLLGRLFTGEEDAGQKPVALLSERLWRSRFHADANIVGRTVRLEQTPFTVVGIIPGRTAFPAWADFWMPLSFLEPELRATRKFHPLEIAARLAPGVSVEGAQQEMQGIMRGLAERYPATNGGEGASVLPMQSYLVAPVRGALLLVWLAVALVLLIVCVNVAHLVLARATVRGRELAIRAALGASRWDLARVLIAENAVIAVLGGALGLALAALLTPIAARFANVYVPRGGEVAFDAGVLGYGLIAAVVCLALFCVPAIGSVLRASLRGAFQSNRGVGMGRVLIAAEVALAFVVMAGALLVVRSFGKLMAVEPGFDANRVMAMNVTLPRPAYDWEGSQRLFDQQIAPRLRALPGVEFVGAGNVMPLTLPGADQIHRFATRFGLPGETYEEGRYPIAQARWGTEDYFRSLGIRLVSGRFLEEADRGKPRQMINETLAKRYFPDQDPVGKRILMGVTDSKPSAIEIVGVVSDVRDLNLELPPEPTLYSLALSMSFALLVRGDVPAERVAAVVREAEPSAAIENAGSLAAILSRSLERRRASMWMLAAFAMLAALLAAVGIYGVVSYAVGRRVREFGVRLALGARPREVLGLILKETVTLAVSGLAAGALLCAALAPMAEALLFGVAPYDPVAWGAGALVLLGAGVAAAWIPARRAAGLDPAACLRSE